MSEIDDQIAAIKLRREAAYNAKIRAEATRESAQVIEASALAKLKEEFGVDNLADARVRLEELQAEVQSRLAEISKELDEIEL